MTMFLTRVAFNIIRSAPAKCLSGNFGSDIAKLGGRFVPSRNELIPLSRVLDRAYTTDTILPLTSNVDNSSIGPKKKIIHKKPASGDFFQKEGHYLTFAYVTAHSYDLKRLKEGLLEQKLYEPANLKAKEIGDVVIANAVYNVGTEPREVIFFREGAVVFWNCTELEARNVLDFVRPYETESYPKNVVEKEREMMSYFYQDNVKKCHLQESSFVLVPDRDNSLERYTFSHAMAQSARLGAWEERLEALATSVRAHTRRMEEDGTTKVHKKEVVQKLGELFSLRHRLNVESDLLDLPDFYWEEEQLEKLYSHTVFYFNISKRTKVLNERLAHCVELLELLSSWAADRHHIRLEWMIIALILAEVCFELFHIFENRELPSFDIRELLREYLHDGRPWPFANDNEQNLFLKLQITDTM